MAIIRSHQSVLFSLLVCFVLTPDHHVPPVLSNDESAVEEIERPVGWIDKCGEVSHFEADDKSPNNGRVKRSVPWLKILSFSSDLIGFIEGPLSVYDFIADKFDGGPSNKEVLNVLQEGFHQMDRKLTDLDSQLKAIASSLNKVENSLGLKVVYNEEVKRIRNSFVSLHMYINSTSVNGRNHYKSQFLTESSKIELDLRHLLEGLLGYNSLTNPDIMATIRDDVECHPRLLQNRTESFMGIVNLGWIVYASYSSLILPHTDDNKSFKTWYSMTYAQVKNRLVSEVDGCHNERNVTTEIVRIIRKMKQTPGPEDANIIADAILDFLSDKYDSKHWIVVFTEASTPIKSYSHLIPAGQAWHTVQNELGMNVIAHSIDPRTSNSTDFRESVQVFNTKTRSRLKVLAQAWLESKFTFSSVGSFWLGLHSMLGPLLAGCDIVVIDLSGLNQQQANVITRNGITFYQSDLGLDARWYVMAVPKPFVNSNLPKSCYQNFTDILSGDVAMLRNGAGGRDLYLSSDDEGWALIEGRQEGNLRQMSWRLVGGELINGFGQILKASYSRGFCRSAERYMYVTNGSSGSGWNFGTSGLSRIQETERNTAGPIMGDHCSHAIGVNTLVAIPWETPHWVKRNFYYHGTVLRAHEIVLDSYYSWFDWPAHCVPPSHIERACSNRALEGNPLWNIAGLGYLTVCCGELHSKDPSSVSQDGQYIMTETAWYGAPEQSWRFSTGQLRNKKGKCLTALRPSSWYIYQYDCNLNYKGQQWKWSSVGQIVNGHGYCLTADISGYVIQDYCRLNDHKQRWSQCGTDNGKWNPPSPIIF